MITVGTDDGNVLLALKEDGGVEMLATLSPRNALFLAEQLLLASKQMREYNTETGQPYDPVDPNV